MLARLVNRVNREPSQGDVAMGVVGLLISALVTDAIGVHAVVARQKLDRFVRILLVQARLAGVIGEEHPTGLEPT
jgi:hypothetical protein